MILRGVAVTDVTDHPDVDEAPGGFAIPPTDPKP